MTDPIRFAAPEGDAPAPIVVPVPVARPKRASGGLTNALLVVATIVAVGGVTFAIGRATAPASAGGLSAGALGANGLANGGAFPAGSFDPGSIPAGGPGGFGDRTMTLSGTVASVDGSTMVITSADGTQTTIDISESTYHAQAAATASDVTEGATVQVSVSGFGGRGGPDASAAPDASGAPAASGSVTAAGTGAITATDVTITGQ